MLIKLVAAFLALVFHYQLALLLPASEFGLFTVAMSCLLFATAFAKQGFEQASVRFVAQADKNSVISIYKFIILSATKSAFITAVIIWLLADIFAVKVLNKPQLTDLIPLVALLTIIQTWLSINASVFKGHGYAAFSLLFIGIISYSAALGLFTVFEAATAFEALILFIYALAFACLVSFTLLFKVLPLNFVNIKTMLFTDLKPTNQQKDIKKASRNLLIISLSALVTQQLSPLILAKYVTLAEVGTFALAIKIAMLMSYPLVVINAITAPKYARLYKAGNYIAFKKLALNNTAFLFALASLGVAIVFVAIEPVITLFDSTYLNAILLVKILVLGQWVNLATGSVVSMLIMSGHEKLVRRNMLIITIINMIALVIFIPYFGAVSAAIITAIAMATKNIASLFYVNKLIYSKANESGTA